MQSYSVMKLHSVAFSTCWELKYGRVVPVRRSVSAAVRMVSPTALR